MSEIHNMWDKTGITVKPEEGDFRNNGERASCEYIHINVGRWFYIFVVSDLLKIETDQIFSPVIQCETIKKPWYVVLIVYVCLIEGLALSQQVKVIS